MKIVPWVKEALIAYENIGLKAYDGFERHIEK